MAMLTKKAEDPDSGFKALFRPLMLSLSPVDEKRRAHQLYPVLTAISGQFPTQQGKQHKQGKSNTDLTHEKFIEICETILYCDKEHCTGLSGLRVVL
jgi:hypothetical protein